MLPQKCFHKFSVQQYLHIDVEDGPQRVFITKYDGPQNNPQTMVYLYFMCV